MTSRSPTSRLLEISPLRDVVLKQLDMKAALNIKSLAKLFEDGGGQGLLDYRASNLLEDNTAARRVFQEALTQMPDELRLLASLLSTAQELCDRVAGRNSEDAETIVAGLRELLTQWTAREAAVKAALAEARHGADDALVAALETAACERGQHLAQIAALEAKLKATKQQADTARATIELNAVKKAFSSPLRVASSDTGYGGQPQQEGNDRIRAVWRRALSPAARSLQIVGRREVGATLHTVTANGEPPSPIIALQWLRQVAGSGELEVIAGAVRCQYSPEPADGGCTLAVRSDAYSGGAPQIIPSAGGINLPQELEQEASALVDCGGAFNVVVVQFNGAVQRQKVVSVLHVTPEEVALHAADGTIRCQAAYHGKMQVCGARGGGDGAAQGLFLAFNRGQAFMLACESSKQRNVCILLIRKLAAARGYALKGPITE